MVDVPDLFLGTFVNSEREQHWCKHCERTFTFRCSSFENRALLLECPTCFWRHPRQFEAGVAIHCEITKMVSPVLVKGQ